MPHSAHSWKTRIHHQKLRLLSHLIRSMKELSSPPHRLAVTEERAYLGSHGTSLRGQAWLQDQTQAHVKGPDTEHADTQPGQVRPQNREAVHEETGHDGRQRHGGGAEQVGSPQPPGLGVPHPAPCKAASGKGARRPCRGTARPTPGTPRREQPPPPPFPALPPASGSQPRLSPYP